MLACDNRSNSNENNQSANQRVFRQRRNRSIEVRFCYHRLVVTREAENFFFLVFSSLSDSDRSLSKLNAIYPIDFADLCLSLISSSRFKFVRLLIRTDRRRFLHAHTDPEERQIRLRGQRSGKSKDCDNRFN